MVLPEAKLSNTLNMEDAQYMPPVYTLLFFYISYVVFVCSMGYVQDKSIYCFNLYFWVMLIMLVTFEVSTHQ